MIKYKTLRFLHLISKKKYKKLMMIHTKEYRLISKSRYFDKIWYNKTYNISKLKSKDPINHYLKIGWKKGYNPSKLFDGEKYLDMYFDVKKSGLNPLVHYEMFGKREKRKLPFVSCSDIKLSIVERIIYKIYTICYSIRIMSYSRYDMITKKFKYADYRAIYKSPLFNKHYYYKMYGQNKFTDAVDHYLHQGFKLGYNPSAKFDNDFYLTNNSDILYAGLNPLFHYETSGKYENRPISIVSDKFTINYSSVNGDILLFSHELSLTGAPIALLNMAKIIKSNGLNPIVFSPKHGELESELKANEIDYIVEPYLLVKLYRQDKKLETFLSSFESILFNTIDTLKYAQHIKTQNKKLCWVHEGEFGYKCANSAFDINSAFKNIDTVYSVGEYSKSFTDKYIPQEKSNILLYGIENIQDIPEIPGNQKLTFGIFGVCCERKGTDLFVQAINKLPKKIKNECCFKVIGRINNDNFCDNLKKISKNIDIIYTGQLSHDDTLKEMAQIDVIVCPSLDDPMPIVCTEAMQLNKPVICSDHTGTASFIEDGVNGFIYRLGQDNLENIITAVYDNRNNLKNIGQKWHEIYIKHFTKEVFDKNIMNILYPERKNHTIQECFELLSNIYEKLQKVV